MEAALVDAKLKREGEASRKRQLILDEITESVKRRRIEPAGESSSLGAAVFAGIAASNGTPAAMATLDATTLPLQTVVELVIATLQGQSEIAFAARISVSAVLVLRFWEQWLTGTAFLLFRRTLGWRSRQNQLRYPHQRRRSKWNLSSSG